jgi:hypothetical protein
VNSVASDGPLPEFLLPTGTLTPMRTYDGLELDVRAYGPQDVPVTVLLSH